ncbi:MAG: ABC transporter permease [Desulfobacterales bacterium]|jgi:ABC-type dipeptide/oligopeptide/nickel transport system permease component|nr:ABC transporter permease [Desulfobacterales bacterium]
MLAYTIRRILMAIPTLWVALTMIFILVRVIPGDPTTAVMGDYVTDKSLEVLKRQMGLDLPLIEQYGLYLYNFVRGDFGNSLITGAPVLKELKNALPHTLELTFFSLLIGTLTGIPLGVFLALKRNSAWDYLGRFFSLAGISFPSFYIAVLLILLFSMKLDLLPVMGVGPAGDTWARMRHLVLPALTLGLLMMSYLTRMTRSTMLDVLGADYIRTAHAKGLRKAKVIFKHALKNASVSIVTVLGIYTGILIGSSVMTEIIFNRPGLGSLIVGSMLNRDYITITSIMTVYAAIVIFINLITDLSYGLIDPRIRYE